MSLYEFSKEAENDLVGIYRYGFIHYGESKADLYIEALKGKCQFLAAKDHLTEAWNSYTGTAPVNTAYLKHKMSG